MKILRYISLTFFLVLFYFILRAQNDRNIEAVNSLRADGKIYVVILVLVTILMGVIFLLTSLDSRAKKIEQYINPNSNKNSDG